jgi:hypothetical protein
VPSRADVATRGLRDARGLNSFMGLLLGCVQTKVE